MHEFSANHSPFFRQLYDQTPGLLSGRHLGAKAAKSNLLLFLDDDVVVDQSWISSILTTFQDLTVHLVGGPSDPDYESPPPQWLAKYWQDTDPSGHMLVELSLLSLKTESPVDVHPCWVFGLNYAIRRSTLFELGGFHPDCVPPEWQHFQGDGETGLSMKIAEKKLRAVYHPRARVHHAVPTSRMTPEYFDRRNFYQGVCDSYSQLRAQYRSAKKRAARDDESDTTVDRADSSHRRLNVRKILQAIRRPRIRHRIETTIAKVHSKTQTACGSRQRVRDETTIRSMSASLDSRFREMKQRGFQFHQQCAQQSPRLRHWIARDDYFEYNYPSLETGLTLPTPVHHFS